MNRLVKLNISEFEAVLHGNRSIDDQDFDLHENVTFICSDFMKYSFPISAKITKLFNIHGLSRAKTTKGIRTSQFPFSE